MLDAHRQRAALGTMSVGPYGPLLDPCLDSVRLSVETGVAVRLRVVRRDRYVDVHVDGLLCFRTIVDDLGRGPFAGVVVDSGQACFVLERAHGIIPLKR